jgi:hypothetical protein
MAIRLGGFQEVATLLTNLSGRSYSRQAVQGLWQRRLKSQSHFPDMHDYVINGTPKKYFNLAEIQKWYKARHPEANHRPQALANIEARRQREHNQIPRKS